VSRPEAGDEYGYQLPDYDRGAWQEFTPWRPGDKTTAQRPAESAGNWWTETPARSDRGDRVRDVRDGSLGTVHLLELGIADRPSEGYAAAEVRWDNLFVADALDVALPHLEPL
jgi:hypothetical protein